MTKATYGDHEDVVTLKKVLFGRSVTAVRMGSEHKGKWKDQAEGEVVLDDGTVLALAGNIGGCSCSAGDYDLTLLNDMPINGIMDVQVEYESKDKYGEEGVYRIFVLAQDDRIKLAEFEGGDGNGCYGTGFWFKIIPPKAEA